MTSIQHINRVKQEKQRCALFNGMYNVGTMVQYWTGLREGIPTGIAKTRSSAQMLGGHSAVVWVKGYGSCISLSHIEVVELECWKVEDGETSWYAAWSCQDALQQHCELFALDPEDDEQAEIDISLYPAPEALWVRAEDGTKRTQSAEKWVEELGRGLICSTGI